MQSFGLKSESGCSMAIGSCNVSAALNFRASGFFGTGLHSSNTVRLLPSNTVARPLVIEARGNHRTDSAKIRERRIRKKFNRTTTKPRLSMFCSEKQLYAILVDDQNKKCLFYGSTLQKSMRKDPSSTTAEVAARVGEELIKTCIELNIDEISSYDRNGLARGERMQAFEIAIGRHGFLPW